MKNSLFCPWVLAAAIVAALAACQQSPEPKAFSNGQPSQVAADVPAVQVGSTKDPSLPDASEALVAQDAADKAKDAALALQQPASPGKDASNDEASKAMPLTTQATPAPDKTRVN